MCAARSVSIIICLVYDFFLSSHFPRNSITTVDVGRGFFGGNCDDKRNKSKWRGGIHLRYRRRKICPITISNPTQRKVIQTKISKLVAVVTSITNLRNRSAWEVGGRGEMGGFVRISNDLSSIKIKMGLRRHRTRDTYIQRQIL